MDENQVVAEYGEYGEKIRAIASKLAINKYNTFQGKGVDLELEISSNVDMVNKKITQIYKEIQNKIPGLDLPKTLNDTIAEYLLRQVSAGIFEINQIDNKGSISNQILQYEVLAKKDFDEVEHYSSNVSTPEQTSEPKETEKDSKEVSLSEKYHGVDDSMFTETDIDPKMAEEYEENIGEIKKVFEVEDGRKIVFVDPIDEKYKIPENEADEVEEEIYLKQFQTQMLDEKVKLGVDVDIDECIDEYKKGLFGLGIDAKLRAEYGKIISFGAIQMLSDDTPYNKYCRETFFALLDSMKKENALENGYEEDSYSLATNLGIFSRILNDPAMKTQGPMQDELRARLRDADPELYALLERDPLILEKMQTSGKTTEPINAMIELVGSSVPIGREEFFQKMDELSRSVDEKAIDIKYTKDFDYYEEFHKDYVLNRKGEMSKNVIRKELAKRKDTIETMSPEVRKRVRKESIQRMIEKAGVGSAVNSYFTLNRIEGDKGQTIDAINELLNFDEIGEEGNYVEQITSKDIEMMKDQLQVLIEHQNEKIAPYICTLGDIISKASEREKSKILSVKDIKTEDIVKQYGDSDAVMKIARKEARIKGATFSIKTTDESEVNNGEHDDR